MNIIENIKIYLIMVYALNIVIGTIPYILILTGTMLIVPFFAYAKHTYDYIQNNKDNKVIYIAGIISIIIPIIITIITFINPSGDSTNKFSGLDNLERVFKLGPLLANIELICAYLCYCKRRYNRTVISDTKNTIKYIKEKKRNLITYAKNNKTKTSITIVIFLLFILVTYAITNYYTIASDKIPLKKNYCYTQYYFYRFEKRNTIKKSTIDDEENETSIYKYIYKKKNKELIYYEKNKLVSKRKILYADDKIIIFDYGSEGTAVCKSDTLILDYYKKESKIDVSGYYIKDDEEIYISKNKKIYFGNKNGIKKGVYEVLEFEPKYLSEPLINYTLEGEKKEGYTEYRYNEAARGESPRYNKTTIYIKELLIEYQKTTNANTLKYLKNIK